jgi:hypothetical protein
MKTIYTQRPQSQDEWYDEVVAMGNKIAKKDRRDKVFSLLGAIGILLIIFGITMTNFNVGSNVSNKGLLSASKSKKSEAIPAFPLIIDMPTTVKSGESFEIITRFLDKKHPVISCITILEHEIEQLDKGCEKPEAPVVQSDGKTMCDDLLTASIIQPDVDFTNITPYPSPALEKAGTYHFEFNYYDCVTLKASTPEQSIIKELIVQ